MFPGNRLCQFEKGLASFEVLYQTMPFSVPLTISSPSLDEMKEEFVTYYYIYYTVKLSFSQNTDYH